MSNLERWLRGDFTCRKCGVKSNSITLGYGEMICPNCYKGEQPFIFLDMSFILNRLLGLLQLRIRKVRYVEEKEVKVEIISAPRLEGVVVTSEEK